jgi:hypothetical protein
MVTREDLKEKIEEQLARWKTAIDGLKEKFDQAEADAKAKLHDQIESLHDRRIKAEKILHDVSAAIQDVWEQVKSGAEQGWTELTRTAKNTMGKVRDAIAHPNRDEEIRQIAYHLWRDEGCPDGRHDEHWFKAESIWIARHTQTKESVAPAPAKAKQPRKKPAAPSASKSRTTKPKAGASRKRPDLGEKTP